MIDKVDWRERLDKCDGEDLRDIKNLIDEVEKERTSARFNSLANQILTAIHAMEKEFPYAEINISYDGDDINLLDYTWDMDNFDR